MLKSWTASSARRTDLLLLEMGDRAPAFKPSRSETNIHEIYAASRRRTTPLAGRPCYTGAGSAPSAGRSARVRSMSHEPALDEQPREMLDAAIIFCSGRRTRAGRARCRPRGRPRCLVEPVLTDICEEPSQHRRKSSSRALCEARKICRPSTQIVPGQLGSSQRTAHRRKGLGPGPGSQGSAVRLASRRRRTMRESNPRDSRASRRRCRK